MCKIIVDFEMNCGMKREIIEVGAVRLNEKNQVFSEFCSYVRPRNHISKRTFSLTGIKQSDVVKALELKEVLDDFLEWIGDDCTAIYSWSSNDLLQLEKECAEKRIENNELRRIFSIWHDYQKEFGELLHYNGQLSLKNAVSAIDSSFIGKQHSALNDARNTAVVFEVAHGSSKNQVLQNIKEWFTASQSGITIGELFPDLAVL